MNERSYILVTGSIHMNVGFCRGVKQGDPMSTFLFILPIEGLHLVSFRVEHIGLFRGASISHISLEFSYLLYAYHVMFLWEGSQSNASNLVCIPMCFSWSRDLKLM